MITPLQMRLARTAVGWSVRELSGRVGIAPSTILRFEGGNGDMLTRTRDRIQQELEEAGVIFIAADAAGGPGVRVRG